MPHGGSWFACLRVGLSDETVVVDGALAGRGVWAALLLTFLVFPLASLPGSGIASATDEPDSGSDGAFLRALS
jgi:hypothetical protein